jgi:aryl-alcohol dehydrogenase-like predicted oxidoreductase
MKYNPVGRSGLKVSSLAFGTMTFGDGADEAMSKKLYRMCQDIGINTFDCANVYAGGISEKILGELVKGHRDEVVLTTKAYYPMSGDINARGGSRFHLIKALDDSLKRLDIEYIDIYYLHCFDEETPLEESLSALNDFVRQGKVLYLGLSNFASWQVMKAKSICEQKGFASITCIQPMYNLLRRQCEAELLPMADSEGLGVFSYGPLAGGLLTGKYLKDKTSQGRLNQDEMYRKRYADQTNLDIAENFVNFANVNGYHPVSLAIAWAAAHKAVTAPLIGARKTEQLAPVLASLDIQMTEDLYQEISALSPRPALPTDRTEEHA